MPDVVLYGPEGRIEARYEPAEKADAPAALLLHPNPLLGGTMNTKVVYHLYHAFSRRGFSVARFNFRGVGLSEGERGAGHAEVADAACVIDWLQTQNPEASKIWVVGFSFGAWVALQLLMRRPEVGHFVAVAPPADKYDFDFLHPCPGSGLIVQGDADSVVSHSASQALARALNRQENSGIEVRFRSVPGADHFFKDHMETLLQIVEGHVRMQLEGGGRKRARSKAGAKKKSAGGTARPGAASIARSAAAAARASAGGGTGGSPGGGTGGGSGGASRRAS